MKIYTLMDKFTVKCPTCSQHSLLQLLQEYVKDQHPDAVELAGFLQWVSEKKYGQEMEFADALDLVERGPGT